jgi:hypothetical protein
MMNRIKIVVLAAMFGLSSSAMASSKNLIELEGGKPVAGMAKSWKKVKDGEYEFELDTTAEVKKGVPVSPKLVKDSLESKLGTTYGVKVTEKGPSTVSVAYTSDENTFLEQISKTRIREKSVELALESSVSEGGIRAKKADRAPTAGEVKAIVQKIEAGMVTARVDASKYDGIKKGAILKISTGDAKYSKRSKLFFMPEKEENGVWTPKAGTLK